ncbi:MAG: DUF5906 domain-containing protein [Fusobacteriaceae bacterium]
MEKTKDVEEKTLLTKTIISLDKKIKELKKQSIKNWLYIVDGNIKVARIDNQEGCIVYHDEGFYKICVNSDIEFIAIEVLRTVYGAGFEPNLKVKLTEKLMDILKYHSRSETLKFTKPKRIPLVFSNGTLYFENGSFNFSPSSFNPEDKTFFKFNFRYSEPKEEPSIFQEWAKLKFGKNTTLFYSIIADIFLTWNDSQVLPYIFGNAGIGKSTMQEVLSHHIGSKSIANVKVNDLGKRFQNNDLFRKIINLSSEIQDREIQKEAFKGAIARDLENFEPKGKESYLSRPLAKWLAVAEKMPNIETDGGVQRRILPLEATPQKLKSFQDKELSKEEFKKLLLEDKQGFTSAIMEGLTELEKFNFDLKKMYDEKTEGKQLFQLVKQNNSIVDFIDETTKPEEGMALRVVDLYNLYIWATQNKAEFKGKNGKITLKTFTGKIEEHYKSLYNLENRGTTHGQTIKRGNYLIGFNYTQETREDIEHYNESTYPKDKITIQLSELTTQANYIFNRK